ncbi:metal-dependent phosphohydrolase HD sub domain protein [Syntrophobotulus glycolicus DSM 8271]|uniref:Metal-dependent phosphohydrolase HD sub domain protein n=1 Tax=Syntrophobotulus glycolicus (strain DSM 8271 / FlGlyR) TaxID=645991 RepID=F0T2E6_SYNGF|nr:HD domain-containing protein [Syntrophobotulus glycolicus]ADY55264.1 metal-dependent phosphohydrolase HD sub domain protein [Syntrophobotulus glycolicus DSM 8271]
MDKINHVLNSMISYYAGDARRINHFLKVYGFAKVIGAMEGLDNTTREILEITALTHDIGIKNSEIKYQSSNGSHQQIEGPPEAKKLLAALSVEQGIIERVCWLIAHHHTYKNIEGLDYQILVEADFLVNIFEDEMPISSIKNIREKIFKTRSGLKILDNLYPDNLK